MCYLTTLISPFVMHSRYSTMSRSNNREIPAPGPGTRKDSIRRRSTKDPKRYNSWTALLWPFLAPQTNRGSSSWMKFKSAASSTYSLLFLLQFSIRRIYGDTRHQTTYKPATFLYPTSKISSKCPSKVDVFRRLSESSTSKLCHQTCRMLVQRPKSSIHDIESTIT